MAQVSGWVPKERRPYAREVLAALARGSNSLPPDPEQRAALEAAQAAADAARAAEANARAALAKAEQRVQVLATDLEAARTESKAARDEATRDLATLRAEAEAMQAREQAAQDAAAALQGELDGIKGRRGWRGVLLRLARVGASCIAVAALGGCSPRHVWMGATIDPEPLPQALRGCVSIHDPERLDRVRGDEQRGDSQGYIVRGWSVPDERYRPVVRCMQAKGWISAPMPLVP